MAVARPLRLESERMTDLIVSVVGEGRRLSSCCSATTVLAPGPRGSDLTIVMLQYVDETLLKLLFQGLGLFLSPLSILHFHFSTAFVS